MSIKLNLNGEVCTFEESLFRNSQTIKNIKQDIDTTNIALGPFDIDKEDMDSYINYTSTTISKELRFLTIATKLDDEQAIYKLKYNIDMLMPRIWLSLHLDNPHEYLKNNKKKIDKGINYIRDLLDCLNDEKINNQLVCSFLAGIFGSKKFRTMIYYEMNIQVIRDILADVDDSYKQEIIKEMCKTLPYMRLIRIVDGCVENTEEYTVAKSYCFEPLTMPPESNVWINRYNYIIGLSDVDDGIDINDHSFDIVGDGENIVDDFRSLAYDTEDHILTLTDKKLFGKSLANCVENIIKNNKKVIDKYCKYIILCEARIEEYPIIIKGDLEKKIDKYEWEENTTLAYTYIPYIPCNTKMIKIDARFHWDAGICDVCLEGREYTRK